MTTTLAGRMMFRCIERMREACCAGSGTGMARKVGNQRGFFQRVDFIFSILAEYPLQEIRSSSISIAFLTMASTGQSLPMPSYPQESIPSSGPMKTAPLS